MPWKLLACAAIFAGLHPLPARAVPVVYHFTGIGAFARGGTTLQSGFSFDFTGDTGDVIGPFGSFHEAGGLAGTVGVAAFGLAAPLVDFLLQSDGAGHVSFFDSASPAGVTLTDGGLSGYALGLFDGPATAAGVDVVVSPGDIALADGSVLGLLGVDSVSFTATAPGTGLPVPEPAGLLVLGAGLAALGWRRRAG